MLGGLEGAWYVAVREQGDPAGRLVAGQIERCSADGVVLLRSDGVREAAHLDKFHQAIRNLLLFIVWISEGGCKVLGVEYGEKPDLNNVGIQQPLEADREAARASRGTGLQSETKPTSAQKKKKPGTVEVDVEHGKTGRDGMLGTSPLALGDTRGGDEGAAPSARNDEEKNDEKGQRRISEWMTPENKENKRQWAEVDADLWITPQKRRLL